MILSLTGASDLLSTTGKIIPIIAALVAIAGAAAGAVGWLTARRRRPKQRQSDTRTRDTAAAELNAAFAGAAEIKGFPRSDPRLVAATGAATLVVDEPIRVHAEAMRQGLINAGRNELHALLVGDSTWHGDPYTWVYETVDFATIVALREAGSRFPPIITANALVCCAEKGLVYLLRRSSSVATYPNCWHIMGGNFTAAGQQRLHDSEDLGHTASRELSEEMGVHITIPQDIERVGALECSEEATRDFVQLTYLGLNLHATLADRIKPSDEGGVVAMTLSDLAGELLTSGGSWVPSGQMQVLMWLALGAPTFGDKARFDGAEARRIYDRWRTALPAGGPG